MLDCLRTRADDIRPYKDKRCEGRISPFTLKQIVNSTEKRAFFVGADIIRPR
jgi:hypothetical protein